MIQGLAQQITGAPCYWLMVVQKSGKSYGHMGYSQYQLVSRISEPSTVGLPKSNSKFPPEKWATSLKIKASPKHHF